MTDPTIVVAQLGARMHYAVPRILHRAGRLAHLYTDFCVNTGWPAVLRAWPKPARPKGIQRLVSRHAAGVPADRITAFNILGIRYARQLRRAQSASDRTRAFLWSGRAFGELVVRKGFGRAGAVYTFNTAGVEILQAARASGLLTVMEQTIAPKQLEMELLATERSLYPDWEPMGGSDDLAMELAGREAAEWKLADRILCACEFVRDGIERCGGPSEKCLLVPYGVDVGAEVAVRGHAGRCTGRGQLGRPLRVLTVGAVGLRKGTPYVLAAAELMRGAADFRLVGPVNVSADARRRLSTHLELVGPVPRSAVREHFEWADVFLLPSVCEGSATVTYEALAYGLPVVCTPNTGSVMRDGVEGYIVPVRDPEAIADRLESLMRDAELLHAMSERARLRSAQYSVQEYGRRLLCALGSPTPSGGGDERG